MEIGDMNRLKAFSIPALFIAAGFLLPGPAAGRARSLVDEGKRSLSVFPILMYDSNIGIGYGGKARAVDYLGSRESFDLILFNSSKGERWYVLAFSLPDFEIRQGKSYALGLDLKAEYDMYLKYAYYGAGSRSTEDDRTSFSMEKSELRVCLSRGFRDDLVLEFGAALKRVRFSNISSARPFSLDLEAVGSQLLWEYFLALRFDTSDSRIHPLRGFRGMLQADAAPGRLGNKHADFLRLTLDLRGFRRLWGERDVLAGRLLVQNVTGPRIPLYDLSALGGAGEMSVLRGYALGRFLDRSKLLINLEYRIPIWKRLGGVLFLDAGTVGPSPAGLDVGALKIGKGGGLRYYLKNFLVRFDIGFGREGIGIYFNFGHVF